MSFDDYVRSHTHRQHTTWVAWLDLEWDRPSRADHYAMQIARCVLQANAKKGARVKHDDMRLKFLAPTPKPVSVEVATAWSQAKWFAALGMETPKKDGG